MMAVEMLMPIDCPCCGDPLLNEYDEMISLNTGDKITYLTKVCRRRPSHTIEIRACVKNDDYVDFIRLPYLADYSALWYMGTGHLLINDHRTGKDCHLPFFMPDLSDYPGLLKKIQTYLVFS